MENLSEYRWSTIDAIYLIGAMTDRYPKEPPMKNIWIYYPETDTWKEGPEIPENRQRGSAGAVLYNDKIFIAAGSPNRGGGNLTSIEVFSSNHTWEKLFNGENLHGWQVMCQEKDNEKEFDDFELRLKFMVSRESSGNSGVQIRSRYDKVAVVDDYGHAGWLDGPQVDIDPTNPWRNGFIYDETRNVKRWINPSLPDWKIDKETHAPKRVIFYWEDEESGWNDMTIICRGTHIKTIVNNIVVSDYDGAGVLDDKAHQKQRTGLIGQIALQLHKKSENRIWFKDIEIKELK
ncbi:MAG: DUF1080 domain-containing protein [Bacteroidales bacterium]